MFRQQRLFVAYTKNRSAFIVTGIFFAVLFMSARNGLAQDSVCIKNVVPDLTLNGVVAQGAGGGCPVGPVWSQTTPVEYLPSGGSPNAFLYLAMRPSSNRLFIGIDLKGDADLSNQDIVYVVFDVNNNDVFDVDDFLIKVQVWPGSPIETGNTGGLPGADCNKVTGPIEVRRFVTGTGWEIVSDPAVAAAIQTKLSYDYETAVDAEDKIWNLEISLPINSTINGVTYFPLQSASPFFGIASYIFMDTGHFDGTANPQLGTVLKWPSSMVDRTITQQNLFGIPATTADQLGNSNLSGNCFDVNFTAPNPWMINGFVAGQFDNRINRNGNNTFRVTYFFDGPGSTDTPLTNNGTVKLALTPYRASGSGTVWVKTVAVDAQRFNHASTVEFNFDFANPDPSFGPTSNINFVCATMTLQGFQRDDSIFNNSFNVNHNEFTTSEYPMDFAIFGAGIPNLKPGESTTVIMRLDPTNDPAAKKASADEVKSSPVQAAFISRKGMGLSFGIFAASLIAIWLSLKLRPSFNLRRYASVLAVLAILVFTFQLACKRKTPPDQGGTVIGTERWTIKNAAELGIKPVPGERDVYEMPITHGEVKHVQVVFTGTQLPYQTTKHEFNALGQDGKPNVLKLPVRPGQIATIISFGQVDLDGPDGPLPATTATGMVMPRNVIGRGVFDFVLRSGYYSANEHAGALIGSFDNFETSFVIGRSASVRVPEQATELSLAINSFRDNIRITGKFDINVIFTKMPDNPTHTSIHGDGTFQSPHILPNWDVLTTLNVYTYYVTNETAPDGRRRFQTRNIWGAAHMSIYDSHVTPR